MTILAGMRSIEGSKFTLSLVQVHAYSASLLAAQTTGKGNMLAMHTELQQQVLETTNDGNPRHTAKTH